MSIPNINLIFCRKYSKSFLVYAFNIGFYALPLMADIGFSRGFGLLAALNGVALIPLVFLIYKGQSIREKQGVPKEHQDL
jgi:hypothetical protein